MIFHVVIICHVINEWPDMLLVLMAKDAIDGHSQTGNLTTEILELVERLDSRGKTARNTTNMIMNRS